MEERKNLEDMGRKGRRGLPLKGGRVLGVGTKVRSLGILWTKSIFIFM